jgi:hypothetical protein
VIVSTTLKELNAGAGHGVTGGGTLLPMRDVIRMGRHAYHYLAVFDDHQSRPLYLGRSKRVASPDQRVVLYAKKCANYALLGNWQVSRFESCRGHQNQCRSEVIFGPVFVPVPDTCQMVTAKGRPRLRG